MIYNDHCLQTWSTKKSTKKFNMHRLFRTQQKWNSSGNFDGKYHKPFVERLDKIYQMNMQQYCPTTNIPAVSPAVSDGCSLSSEELASPRSSQDTSQILHPFQFPWRLHEMLEEADTEGHNSIVSWLPGGKAFKVHEQKAFVGRIMPRYFNQTKYRSFQRQLNVWGFERIQDGPGRGGYTHKWLVRNKPSLCHQMKRERTKGTHKKQNPQGSCVVAPCFISAPKRVSPVPCASSTPDEGPSSRSLLIDQCLVPPLEKPLVQENVLTSSLPDMRDYSMDMIKPVSLVQTPLESSELRKQFPRSFGHSEASKDGSFTAEDLKYVLIGLKWGSSIFTQGGWSRNLDLIDTVFYRKWPIDRTLVYVLKPGRRVLKK